jgi:hypothetical protein
VVDVTVRFRSDTRNFPHKSSAVLSWEGGSSGGGDLGESRLQRDYVFFSLDLVRL